MAFRPRHAGLRDVWDVSAFCVSPLPGLCFYDLESGPEPQCF